jgi:ABC-type Mn2+/Zn2+ transport system ATPase subunit
MIDSTEGNASSTIIRADDVSFSYRSPSIHAIESMSFELETGTFTAVMGPNGSGKSTLLRLMLGLLRPDSGQILLMGENPAETPDVVQRLVGYVPQYESINMRLPIHSGDIVGLGIAARTGARLGDRNVRRKAVEALDAVGLSDVAGQQYGSLSGGQRQRVLIARALAVDPQVLVLDEPFSAMDLTSQRTTAELLSTLVNERGLSIITVVHNVNTIVHFIERVLLMNKTLIAEGPPDEVLQRGPLELAYGATVPIIVCEEGFRHPIMEDSHG